MSLARTLGSAVRRHYSGQVSWWVGHMNRTGTRLFNDVGAEFLPGQRRNLTYEALDQCFSIRRLAQVNCTRMKSVMSHTL